MVCCLNPDCENPINPDSYKFCKQCGTRLFPQLRQHYTILKPIGRGGFGKTYLAADTDNLNNLCVVKQFTYQTQNLAVQEKALELFAREAKQLQMLGTHSQIPSLLAYFQEAEHFYLVQQYIEGLNLLEILESNGAFSEDQIHQLLLDLLPILQFIHDQGVIHRDLKPENIMRRTEDNQYILIDFGISKQLAQTMVAHPGTMVGSPGYVPVEQIQGGQATPSNDLFSLGSTCFHLLSQIPPSQLWNKYGYDWVDHWSQFAPQSLGELFRAILDQLLKKNPTGRYQSARQVLNDLQSSISSPGRTNTSAVESVLPPTEIYQFPSSQAATEPTPGSDSTSTVKGWIGVDLGTIHTTIAMVQDGQPEVLINALGDRETPTVIAFTDQGKCLLGKAAKEQILLNPLNTFDNFLQFLGQDFADVNKAIHQVSYSVKKGLTGEVRLECPALNRDFSAEELLECFLRELFKGLYILPYSELSVVVTMPSHFRAKQRTALWNAFRKAKLDIRRNISSSTAAALCWAWNQPKNQTLCVLDLGGEYLDISITETGDRFCEVLASNTLQVGGNDLDHIIVEVLADEFQQLEGIDLRHNPQAYNRLKQAAETAKIELSTLSETTVRLPFIAVDHGNQKSLEIKLAQNLLQGLAKDLCQQCQQSIETTITESKSDAKSIDTILVLGGAMKSSYIQSSIINQLFSQSIIINDWDLGVKGATILSGCLSGELRDVLLLDALDYALVIETLHSYGSDCTAIEYVEILPKNSTIPTQESQVFTTCKDNQAFLDLIIHEQRHEGIKGGEDHYLRFAGIPQGSAGTHKIQVIFDFDESGILNIQARLQDSQEQLSIVQPLSREVRHKESLYPENLLFCLPFIADIEMDLMLTQVEMNYGIQKRIIVGQESLDVIIPAGVKVNSYICVHGKGKVIPRADRLESSTRGDLLLRIKQI